MRTEPICCGNAPPIARRKTWKTVWWHRSTQIVADRHLMLEKLGSDHRADRVASMVFGSGLATPVAVEPRHGIGTARLQFSSYDVSIDYGTSVSLKSWRSRAVSATSSASFSIESAGRLLAGGCVVGGCGADRVGDYRRIVTRKKIGSANAYSCWCSRCCSSSLGSVACWCSGAHCEGLRDQG